MRILKVVIDNIRSHTHFEFEPAIDGVTAISGANGVGKSSIIDSIGFCLFGIKPAGVSKNAALIRKGVVPSKEDHVGVDVYLSIDDTETKISRTIVNKTGSVECNVYDKVDSEWVLKAGPAVSFSEGYIRQKLGIDDKGFLSAILVAQKQVDALILAPPKERGKIIEKLTGISSATAAVDLAKDELRVVKRSISNYSYDSGEIENIEKSISSKTQRQDNAKTQAEKVKVKLEETDKNLEVSNKKFLSGSKALWAKETDSKALDEVLEHIDETKHEFDDTLALKKELKEKLVFVDDDEVAALKKKQGELRAQVSSLARNLSMLQLESDDAKKDAARVKATVCEDSDALKTENDKLEKKFTENEGKISDGAAKISAIHNEIASLKKNVRVLSGLESGDNVCCPTCYQELKGGVAGVTDYIRQNITQKQAEAEKLEETISKLKGDNVSCRQKIDENVKLIDNTEVYHRALEVVKANKPKIVELSGQISEINKSIAKNEEMLAGLNDLENRKRDYERVLKKCEALSKRYDSLVGKRDSLNASLAKLQNVSKEKIDRIEQRRDKLSDLKDKIQDKYNDLQVEIGRLDTELDNLKTLLSRSKKEAERYNKMIKANESLLNSVQVLEEFRVNRIENSIPVIEMYASEFLTKFTNGDMPQVIIDGKFNVFVVKRDGQKYPVTLLSGGELSAVAMSIRLAISLMLNASGVIILDEIFVSQDKERSENMIYTIKEMCKGQIIIVSHTNNLGDMADKTILL